MWCMCVCVCLSVVDSVHHVHAGDYEGQKRASDTLDLQLQLIVSYHVDARNRTQVL